MKTPANKLINESSPYLLQHAYNPVDWYPWGEEALTRAKEEDKPILVSIGYAACHWCHVMERESFEDEATASIMNEHFINIKIDREERPDLDHIYMDAVQAMTGSGGWPLNVFLTPDARPFYGGTYFPPRPAFNVPAWKDMLTGVAKAFKERRTEVDSQAATLVNHIKTSNTFGLSVVPPNEQDKLFSWETIDEAYSNIIRSADKEWGGFGNAPKFPQTFSIRFLLHYYWLSGNKEALDQVLLSLDKMINGGIYDQLGGGFARYSTDKEWLAPHFEKMLYDNALLIMVLSEAYQLTGIERYKEVIEETVGFVSRELGHPEGGFYAALDADSEGEEGKFYVWDREEVIRILGKDADLFSAYYDIKEGGNWEGHSILRVLKPVSAFAKENGMGEKELEDLLAMGRTVLMKERDKRIRPLLDDKTLLGWNALMNTALCMAYGATGNELYKELAERNMNFLLKNFRTGAGKGWYHTWKEGKARYPAFLDDLAFLIQALIMLQETTADLQWLKEAKEITEFVIEGYSEEGSGYFYYTHKDQGDVIVRKKEVYDGALPSGNSVMAANLLHLSIYFERADWRERSVGITASLGRVIIKYPTSFGVWAAHLQELVAGTNEIVVTGKGYGTDLKNLLALFIPYRVIMAGSGGFEGMPLLNGKEVHENTLFYLCRQYTCRAPFLSLNGLYGEIEGVRRGFNLP